MLKNMDKRLKLVIGITFIIGSIFVKYIQDNLGAAELTQSFGKEVLSFTEVLK